MVVTWQNIPAHLAAQAEDIQRGTIGVDTSAHNGPTCRVDTGPVRYNAGQPEVVNAGPAFHQSTTAGTPGGSILETLDRFGRPSVELVPGDPSSRTSVEVAIRQGYLERDAAGNLKEAGRAEQQAEAEQRHEQQQQQEQQESASADEAHFDAEDERLWAEDIKPLSQSGYESTVARTIGAITNGGDLNAVAMELAKSEGMDPALAQEFVSHGIAKEQRIVERMLSSIGIPDTQHEAVFDHFRSDPRKLQDAMQRHLYRGDLGGWRELAIAYKAQQTDVSGFERAGFETRWNPRSGQLELRRGQGQWRSMGEVASAAGAAR